MGDSDLERIAILVEESAEVQQIAMKIIRHGYDSHNPFDPKQIKNRNLLEEEIAHFLFAIDLMVKRGDICMDNMEIYKRRKASNIGKYLHYNNLPSPPNQK